ncbi:MAG: TonB-dependent receptor [Pseudomonadota bacterium]
MKQALSVLSIGASAIALCSGTAYAQDTSGPSETTENTIVVTGIRASLEDAIDTKRNANAIVDAISAEDIGKFPDRNVAESLQRVPGVVTNREFGEGERVALRGLAPNLTRTLVNGHAVATADWFVLDQLSATRNFNYLVLPSDVVGELQVFKSPTADLEEGGIGGTVNVLTRKPLDVDPFVAAIAVEGAYTERADSLDPQVSGVLSWSNDAGTFGVLAAGVYQKRNIRRDGFEVLGYDAALDPDGLGRQVPILIGSALFEQERERIGGNLEIQFRPSDQLEFGISGFFSRFNADNVNSNYLAWISRSGIGSGATASNIQVVDDTIVAADITGIAAAGGFGQVYDIFVRDAFSESAFIAGDLKYEASDTLTFHAKVGYTEASGDTANQPFVEFLGRGDISFDLTGSAPRVSFSGVDPTVANDLGFGSDDGFASNHEITNDDDEVFVYLDAEKQVDAGPLASIKAGLKYTDHGRTTDFQATTFGGFFLPLQAGGCNGGVCSPAFFGAGQAPSDFAENIAVDGSLVNYFRPDPDIIRDTLGAFLDGLGPDSRVPFFNEIFSVDEETFGGYVQGNFEGENWRGNAGLRVVRTNQTSRGFRNTLPGETATDSSPFGDFILVEEDRSYTDFLPSVNLAYDLQEDLVLRVAAARTLTRPDFTDIAPRVSLNPGALTGSGGSADVEPFRSNQFDLSLEWYPTTGSLFAIAFYYKDVLNFVTDEVSDEVFAIETASPDLTRCMPTPGSTNPDLFDCMFSINRRTNGGTAEVKGIEVIAQTQIAGGFGINANYSFSEAESNTGDPIPGNSRHAFQVGGYYEDDLLSAQLTYNWRDDFFITLDRATSLNQEAFGSLDFSLDVNVTKQISLTFDAVNITNEKIVQFAGEPFRPRAIYDNGRYLFFGARFEY